jgi:hypothetical protein
MLDLIVMADPEYRYFTYRHNWIEGVALAALNDGEGNNMFAVFLGPETGLLKGFDHESLMSPFPDDKNHVWPGIFDEVPDVFSRALANLDPERAVPLDTTFCVWRTEQDDTWKRGNIAFPDDEQDGGFRDLSSLIPLDAAKYISWATEYYERDFPMEAVAAIYSGANLTLALLEAFRADARRASICAEAISIGWPVA